MNLFSPQTTRIIPFFLRNNKLFSNSIICNTFFLYSCYVSRYQNAYLYVMIFATFSFISINNMNIILIDRVNANIEKVFNNSFVIGNQDKKKCINKLCTRNIPNEAWLIHKMQLIFLLYLFIRKN